jgi:fused signal recognition particle receptor
MRQHRRARQAKPQRIEGGFQIGPALRAAMNGKARRFVDHQHQAVAVKHARLNLLRGQLRNVNRLAEIFKTFTHRFKRLTHPAMTEEAPKQNWWRRLSSGLKRTSSSLGTAVADLVTKRKLDRAMLDDIEDVLLRADLGTEVAARISAAVGHGRYDKSISADDVKAVVASEVEKVLAPVAMPLIIDETKTPFVILVVGVNGSGKTTTIGKLAAKFSAEGRKVMLAAGDTFRAAAIEQLKVWGDRTKSPVIAGAQGSDSASLAFNALSSARDEKRDVLLVDTAGRLQNKAELMNELEKVVRVIRKVDVSAPHAVLLVLDATVGQNALSQVEAFQRTAGVTGLVMTKLDGTARGGILVALAEKYKLPVHFIGVGEGVEDLAPFAASDFAKAIAGIE